MAKLPFMKIFVPDLISDTYMLSDGEFGAYARLMFGLWRFKGELPFDHKTLAKVAGSTGKVWPSRWAAISRYFLIVDGVVSHSRITEDLRAASSMGNGNSHQGFPGESILSDKPLENLETTSPRAHSREPQLKPELEPEAATPSAPQPLRGLEDWPDVPPGDLLNLLAVAVAHWKLDPTKDVSTKLHRSAVAMFPRWRAAGCTWLGDVCGVAAATTPHADGPVCSLNYFDGPILSAQKARTAPQTPRPGARHDDKLARKNDNLTRAWAAAGRVAERERFAGDDG